MLSEQRIAQIAKEVVPAWAEWTHSIQAFALAIERATREAAIEECANLCDNVIRNAQRARLTQYADCAANIAIAIRALREDR
jgi:hypothetical protein